MFPAKLFPLPHCFFQFQIHFFGGLSELRQVGLARHDPCRVPGVPDGKDGFPHPFFHHAGKALAIGFGEALALGHDQFFAAHFIAHLQFGREVLPQVLFDEEDAIDEGVAGEHDVPKIGFGVVDELRFAHPKIIVVLRKKFGQPAFPKGMDALLPGHLPIVIFGGMEGHMGIGDIVADVRRVPPYFFHIHFGKGIGEAAEHVLEVPGHYPMFAQMVDGDELPAIGFIWPEAQKLGEAIRRSRPIVLVKSGEEILDKKAPDLPPVEEVWRAIGQGRVERPCPLGFQKRAVGISEDKVEGVVFPVDKKDVRIAHEGIRPVPGRHFIINIEVDIMADGLEAAGIPPFVGVDGMVGEVVDIGFEKWHHARRKGEHRLVVDEAVAKKAPSFGPANICRGPEGKNQRNAHDHQKEKYFCRGQNVFFAHACFYFGKITLPNTNNDMKKPILLLCLFVFLLSSCATNIYLVRHAERIDGSSDSELSAIGHARAAELWTVLSGEKIDSVFATKYRRTQQTAQPTAEALGKNVTTYGTDTTLQFAQSIAHIKNKNLLVVGHSNTVPEMVLYLTGDTVYIGHSDYDNLYKVKIKRGISGEKRKLIKMKYGM